MDCLDRPGQLDRLVGADTMDCPVRAAKLGQPGRGWNLELPLTRLEPQIAWTGPGNWDRLDVTVTMNCSNMVGI